MGEQFNSELKRVEELNKYSKKRASRILDDMATAYLSGREHGGLDKSLIAVRQAKKALRMQGFNQDFIDDYFLQKSYLSKTQLKQFMNESIFTGENGTINPVIEQLQAREQRKNINDLIIDELKSRPELIGVLKRGTTKQNLRQNYNVTSSQLLLNFYEEHKELF